MKNTRLVAPTLADILHLCINMDEDEKRQFTAFTGNVYDPDIAAMQIANGDGPKWGLVSDKDQVICVGGYTYVRPGVWQSVMVASSDGWVNYAKSITSNVKQVMESMFDKGAHRLQTVALADRKLARNWYERIGLQCEGTMVAYGVNGEDAVMYAATEPTTKG